MNKNSGENTVSRMMAGNRVFGAKLENQIGVATEIQNAASQIEKAEEEGNIVDIAEGENKIIRTSLHQAIEGDYLEEQLEDIKTALKIQGQAKEGEKSSLAEHYGIEQSEVDTKIDTLVAEYKRIVNLY